MGYRCDYKLKARTFFTEISDIWHFFVGVFTVFSSFVNNYIPIAIFLVYVVYQSLEEEPVLTTITDFIEFLLGFNLSLLVKFLFLQTTL